MKRPPVKLPVSWSFSRYNDYKLCPLKFRLKHLDKISEPPNEAMARGGHIHKLAEQYIKSEVRRLPPELNYFEDEFKMLRKQYKRKINGMVVEDNWSFTKDWVETQWDDWVNCYVRIKLDCAHHENDETLIVTDWKTGKFRPEMNEDYLEQLELYALAALLLHEHIDVVKPRLAYIDVGVIYPPENDPIIFTRADIPRLKKTWEKRVRPMMCDKTHAPRPNNLCRWCFYRADNKANGGGQCKY